MAGALGLIEELDAAAQGRWMPTYGGNVADRAVHVAAFEAKYERVLYQRTPSTSSPSRAQSSTPSLSSPATRRVA